MTEKVSYELTNPQKSIWNMEEYFKGTTINNICAPDIINEKIDAKALEQALNNIVKKNDSFRIQIELQNGAPMQYIAKYKPFEIEVVHIKNEEDVKQIEKEGINHKFEIFNSSLYHFKIFIMENGCGGFVITAHHLISDSWSMGLVAKHVIEEYHAIRNNEELPQVETSYIHYIEAEKEYKQSKKYETDKTYWNELFESIPEQATIPGSNKAFKSLSCDGKRDSFWLDTQIVEKMNAFCTDNKISAFNFLMAIYAIYLGRVSNLDDFVIGTPILNRANYKEKQAMGMFINTVPVRINTKSEENFASFSRAIGKNMMGVLKHQKYSYNQILEDLRNKNANIPNLYNVMISYQITKAFSKEYGDYKTDWIFNGYVGDDLDIHITDLNDTGELKVSYDYLKDKYTEKDIEDLHKRIVYMIKQVLDNEEILTSELEIVTEEEREKILNDFNNTKVDYPRNKTIVDLFEEQVEKTPENVAVVFENKKITYRELNEKANSLARYLVNNGVKDNDVVSILLNRSLELIIAIYAILKSGASYVLIDPDLPEERIDYITKDSDSKYCITNKKLQNKANIENRINIDEFDFSVFDIKNISTKYNDNLCIIYTSGSTGNPKGVLLNRRGFTNLIYAFDKEMNISSCKNILGIATVSFDMFAVEIYCTTSFGNTLILANEEEQKNPIAMSNLIKKNNVEFLITTPSRIELLLMKECGNPLENLKGFQLGGEKLTENLCNRLMKKSKAKIYNGYGPTEITAFCTNKLISKDDVTIGKPISNVQVYICDANMKLLPIGVSGEICVAGEGITNGYLNNSEATSKSFVKNPYGEGFIYKTGDLGKYRNDGEIEYIGRYDFQVKIRGQRIELGEIEEKISQFPGIKSCIVVKKGDNLSHEFLCAYYNADKSINTPELRDFSAKLLPKYMIPSYFVEVNEWPYNHNGKIDIKKLPEPQMFETKSEIILPRNEVDSRLIEILKEILNVQNVSIESSFFDLGGDSLSAINLGVKVQSEFKAELMVKEILENPIVKDISDIISKKINSGEEINIPKAEKSEYYPLSSAQKRIYFASQVAGENSTLYNTPGGVILDGKIDSKKLEDCINALINRHESLRTYFEVIDEKVVQKIKENIEFKLEILKDINYEKIENIYKEYVKPFDLTKAPLFRAKLAEFTNGKVALFVDMHHIIFDGASMSIFIDELCKLYNGDELSELNITYKDYATFENKMLTEGKLEEAEKYWVHQFEGEIPVLDMPLNYQRPAIQAFEGNKVYSLLDSDIRKQIEIKAQSMGVTPYMLLLSAFYILLSKYTSQDDIVVGTPAASRNIANTENIIGMFVNTLALRKEIDSKSSFKEFVLQVKEKMLNSYKYQTYPFDELVKKIDVKRDTSRNPLFDTMFIYQNNRIRKLDFKGVKSEYFTPDIKISKFDLSLEAMPTDDGIRLSFEYATKLFKEEFIQNLCNNYINIIKNVLENEDTKISDICMLSENEKNKILYEFNDTKVDYEKEKTVVKAFEEQAQKTPNNIAVIFEEQEITYKELNEKANSLANNLRKNGIGRNDLVGIMVNRSIEMIVAILAVLKSGGAYIPIDPTYPQDRVEYMLNSSNAKLLLTQEKLKNKVKFENKIFIELSNKETYSYPTENLESINTPEDLFYVIFTSGSTGRPKGVMIMHKTMTNFTNYCNNYVEYLKNPTYQTILSITTISFDIFAFETIISLQRGLKVVIANENEQTTPKLINALIEKHNITITQSTPSVMQVFVNNIEEVPALKNIKYITLAGEQLPLELVNKLHKIADMKIYNGYGPSETYYVTLTEMNDEVITIGKPLDNTQIYILDKNLKPVPIGSTGELYMSGDCVAKGYLNNDELTKKSFIPNPFVPGTIMYKSGDLGKYTEEGNILCLGRADHQIKIRGQRIELGEIESLMLKYPNIKNATVVKQNIQNRECISAYFISNKRIAVNELRKHLSRSLPRYMVPSYFIALDDFPYTPNGKVDKKALPLPTEVLNVSDEKYVSPKTELQRKLVRTWEKVLNTKPIGINDNFFELGGDSILAMNLNIELLKITNRITYSDIFRFPTIAEQEEKINSSEDSLMFSKIENLSDNYVYILKRNKNKEKVKTWHPKNVLLTGGTGFLGIHILEEFIENEEGNIYCIVREEPGLTAKAKLHQKLNYYFGNKYDDLLDKRIFAVIGNISKPGFGLNQEELLELANSVDVVINSAARVAHFGKYEDFYNSNVRSVRYIIDFCNSFNKKLYHISTIGVSGLTLDTTSLMYGKRKRKSSQVIFDETSLYVGQIIDNVYTRSKFEAESYVLNAISRGLDGYILRMGNLMPRYSDGVFQENILDNAFINKLAAFTKIGVIPDYLANYMLEFTPVDYAAKAVYKIVTHPTYSNRLFHVYNHKDATMDKYMKILKKQGYNIEIVPEEEFKEKINSILQDENSKNLLNNLANDFNRDLHLPYKTDIIIKSDFTTKYLRRIHFKWPKISNKYLTRFVTVLRKVI